jgi:hypothetical protein
MQTADVKPGTRIPQDGPAMLEAAMRLARDGFFVFPVRLVHGERGKIDKQPAIKWKDGATRDEAIIYRWWSGKFADCAVGVTGERFGDDGRYSLLVLDADDARGTAYFAEQRFAYAMDEDGLPPTRTHRTQSGGEHVILKSGVPMSNHTPFSVAVEGRIDVRGAGGYIVTAGRTPNGEYRVVDDAPVADAPAWLLARCTQRGEREAKPAPDLTAAELEYARQRAEEYLSREAPIAVEGEGGDATTFKVACRLRDFGVSQADAVELMSANWNDACEPPWELDELETKVRNAYEYAARPAGHDNTLAQFDVVETPATEAQAAKRNPFKVLSAESDSAPAPLLKLVKGVLGDAGCSVWTGDPDAGKSTVLIDLALHVLHGRPWFGRKVSRGAVLYLAFERADELPSKVDAFYREHPDLAGERAPFRFLDLAGYKLTGQGVRDGVLCAVREVEAETGMPVRLIALDTLRRAMAGDENSSKDFDQFMTVLHQLRAATGAHVAVAHHLGKNKSSGPRGTSAIEGDFDASFELRNGQILSEKLKGRKQQPILYALPVHRMGMDEDGDEITQVAVRPGREIAAEFVEPDAQSQAGKALAVLRQLCEVQGKPADGFPGMPPGARLVSVKAWREACRGQLGNGDADSQVRAFNRAKSVLLTTGLILEHDKWAGVARPRDNL